MNNVMDVLRQDVAHDMLPVLRLKIDYELATLYDAMQSSDQEEIRKCKEKLEVLRRKWIKIKEQ